MEYGTRILLLVLTIHCFLARSQGSLLINQKLPAGAMDLHREETEGAEILNDDEIADLMSLDLGPTSSPLESNASLLAIIESLEHSGAPPPSPPPGSPELGPALQEPSSPDTFFNPIILPPAEEVRRYPSPLLANPVLETVSLDVYMDRRYNLFLPRGHMIRPNLLLRPPKEHRLPPFQALMTIPKESFYPLTIQHQEGFEKVRVNTYGILKPVLSMAIAHVAVDDPHLLAQALPEFSGNEQPQPVAVGNPGPPFATQQQENLERFPRAAPGLSQFGAQHTRPAMPQMPYGAPVMMSQPVQYQQQTHLIGQPAQPHGVPFQPAYAQQQYAYPQPVPMVTQHVYLPGGQVEVRQIPAATAYMQSFFPYQGARQTYVAPPMGYSGGSLDPYKTNWNGNRKGTNNYANYNSGGQQPQQQSAPYYVRPPPPYPHYLHPQTQPQQQLIPFHANQQGTRGIYAYQQQQQQQHVQPGPFPGQYIPRHPPQPYAPQEKHGQSLFKQGPNASHGQFVPKTSPSSTAVGSERRAFINNNDDNIHGKVSPATYYHNNIRGFAGSWPFKGQGPYQAYSGVGPAGTQVGGFVGQNRPTLVPGQQDDPTSGGGGTRVNPYVHFRQTEQMGQQLLQPAPTAPNNNTIPRPGPSRNFTLPEPRPQLEGREGKPEGGQVTEVPLLPTPRRPMPFYSQAAVDGHYRRVSGGNETDRDKEFEDDSQLLQWYVQRAKQVLRERNGKEPNGNPMESKSNSTEGGSGIGPAPPARSTQQGKRRRRRRSIERANEVRLPEEPEPDVGPGWNQFQSDWNSGGGANGIGNGEEPPANPGSTQTDQFLRKIRDSTGPAFGGSLVLPNGFL